MIEEIVGGSMGSVYVVMSSVEEYEDYCGQSP